MRAVANQAGIDWRRSVYKNERSKEAG